MRILHVVHQYLPDKVGGTELYTRMLAQQQVARGNIVAIFTPALDVDQSPVVEQGVQVFRAAVGERSATAVFRSNFLQPDLLKAFESAMQLFQPDIVHVQHLMGLPLALVRRITATGVPYVVTLHDYWHVCANAQLLTNYDESVCAGPDRYLNCARCALARAGHPGAFPLAPFVAPVLGYRNAQLRQVLDHASRIITPTVFARDVHAGLGVPVGKMRVVPHGIELPENEPPRRSEPGRLRVAYLGGIAPQKGVHVLIDAVNGLPHTVELTVAGNLDTYPDYSAALQRRAAHPHVAFVGVVQRAALWDFFAAVDVLVVPSLWYETAALVIQEAFAAGVPVVASRIGALQERVEDGVNGRFFPTGSANALRAILLQFLQEPETLARLREGIQPVRTIQMHINDIDEVYASAL